jgi:putative acetyltransferase
MLTIRPATPADFDDLFDIWLASVRVSHSFLSESEIQALAPLVREAALPNLELWVLQLADGKPVGFFGLDGTKLEALFIAPDHQGQGGGKMLVEFARKLKGPLTVDVNEQNPKAIAFYERNGFIRTGRSETDSGGRPYPLLHYRDRLPSDG